MQWELFSPLLLSQLFHPFSAPMWSHTCQDPLCGGPTLNTWLSRPPQSQLPVRSKVCWGMWYWVPLDDSAAKECTAARWYPACSALEMGSSFVCALSPCELVPCRDLPATGENPVHRSPGGDPKLTWDFKFIVSVSLAHCAADTGFVHTHTGEIWARLFSWPCSLCVQVHAVLYQRKMMTQFIWLFPIVSSLGFWGLGIQELVLHYPLGIYEHFKESKERTVKAEFFQMMCFIFKCFLQKRIMFNIEH